jgi:hypothetical protein
MPGFPLVGLRSKTSLVASDGRDENRVAAQQASCIIAGGKKAKMEIPGIIDAGQDAKMEILEQ